MLRRLPYRLTRRYWRSRERLEELACTCPRPPQPLLPHNTREVHMHATNLSVLLALVSVTFFGAAWRTDGINATMALIAGAAFGVAALTVVTRAARRS